MVIALGCKNLRVQRRELLGRGGEGDWRTFICSCTWSRPQNITKTYIAERRKKGSLGWVRNYSASSMWTSYSWSGKFMTERRFFCFVLFVFINLFYIWLRWVFVTAHRLVAASRGTLCCSVRASHCSGFSCCRAWALGARAQ